MVCWYLRIIPRSQFLQSISITRSNRWKSAFQSRAFSSKEEKDDEPIKFSTSKIVNYNAREYRLSLGRTNCYKHEPHIVRFSVVCFLVYFCILREENDWDLNIDTSLYEKVPDLEIVDLRAKNANHMLTPEQKQRLIELERIYSSKE